MQVIIFYRGKMRLIYLFPVVILTMTIVTIYFFGRSYWIPVAQKFTGKKTTYDVIAIYGVDVRNKLAPYFKKAGIFYPPKKITLLGIKDENILELWASNGDKKYSLIRNYEIKKLSGVSGPKLREGDKQVPEGIYKIIGLNPNSSYHLSMKINYPNDFDLSQAKKDNRTQPGTNIFIHGKSVSIGCLAMGDSTIEELFVLTKDVGIYNTRVIISPTDPRKNKLVYDESTHSQWVSELYHNIEVAFQKYRKK